MLKNAAELEKILEDTAENMQAVDFNNLVDIFFGDRGKKTAQALAQKGGATDLAILQAGANKQLGIDEQVAMQMETAAAQAGIFNEAVNTLKATIGQPFLDPLAKTLQNVVNPALKHTTDFFKNHPEITKYMAAIAVDMGKSGSANHSTFCPVTVNIWSSNGSHSGYRRACICGIQALGNISTDVC